MNLLIPGPVELTAGRDLQAATAMPRIDELLVSVRDYLREEVMPATQGRTNFLARVAGNSLDVVLRELALGDDSRAAEQERLATLLGVDGELDALRWQLVNALRDESMALDSLELQAHLRTTVVNQIAIDQPRYSGFKTAMAEA